MGIADLSDHGALEQFSEGPTLARPMRFDSGDRLIDTLAADGLATVEVAPAELDLTGHFLKVLA